MEWTLASHLIKLVPTVISDVCQETVLLEIKEKNLWTSYSQTSKRSLGSPFKIDGWWSLMLRSLTWARQRELDKTRVIAMISKSYPYPADTASKPDQTSSSWNKLSLSQVKPDSIYYRHELSKNSALIISEKCSFRERSKNFWMEHIVFTAFPLVMSEISQSKV